MAQARSPGRGVKEEVLNDELRRKRLGLDFLNGMSEENIEDLIRRSKEKLLLLGELDEKASLQSSP